MSRTLRAAILLLLLASCGGGNYSAPRNLDDARIKKIDTSKAEKLAGVESFYTAGNMEWPHLLDNALKAHFL